MSRGLCECGSLSLLAIADKLLVLNNIAGRIMIAVTPVTYYSSITRVRPAFIYMWKVSNVGAYVEMYGTMIEAGLFSSRADERKRKRSDFG